MKHNQNSVRLEYLAEAGKNRSTRSRVACAVAFVIGTAMVVQSADYTFKGGNSDFTKPENYTVGEVQATVCPGAKDEVTIPAGTYSLPGKSSSFAVLSGVRRVKPKNGVIFEITVAENDTCTFNAPINYNGGFAYNNADVRCYGKVVKKGAGTLILAASGITKSVADGTNLNMDYFTQIDIQEGTLKLPQHATGNMYFGDLTMAEGTTLVTCGDMTNDESKEKSIFTYLRSLNGNGVITNETGRASGQAISTLIRNENVDNVFCGRICHPAKIWLSGRLAQYGTDTGIKEPIVVQDNRGHLNDGLGYGVYSFDNVGLLGPSGEIKFFGMGGGIHYLGSDDAEVNKTMNLYCYDYPAFVDAGNHGGLTFSGDWNVAGSDLNSAVQKWLVLTGDNSTPCKISGDFIESKFSGKDYACDSPRTIFTQKLGSGAWRFTGNRSHGGGFAIEEGTLQFDSIAEAGTVCSLGRSTNLTAACSVRDPGYENYAFSLGSAKATAPAAAFEFMGSKSCQCSTRPLVLAGKGGSLRASGSGDARIGFSGISARDSGEATLILDGVNKLSNVATGITDGNGVVNVVKDGEGEWYLSGTNTFSGDLRVKAGTLIVQGSKYSWFKFTVKETSNKGQYLAIRQLALYDANGVRQNICLNVDTNKKVLASLSNNTEKYFMDSDWMALAPGSFAFGSDSFLCSFVDNHVKQYIDQLFSDVGNTATSGIVRFDGVTSYGKQCQLKFWKTDGKGISIKRDDSSSWIPFVMRLTNGTPAIVSYDIESFGNDTGMWPTVASMEASVDGIHWELVELNESGNIIETHEYDLSVPLGVESVKNSNRWYSDGTKQTNWDPSNGTTARPSAGFPMRSRADMPAPLANVRSVSVAAGATLKTSDSIVELNSLKVDANGAGTIEGFSFAKHGTLDVTYSGDNQGTVVLPGTYLSCSGMENLSKWSLKLNGAESKSYRIKAGNGRIVLVLRGMFITLR